eukprot:1158529-Pelagomonas_calceolata.AAC.1
MAYNPLHYTADTSHSNIACALPVTHVWVHAADKTAATCLDEIETALAESKEKAEELRAAHAKADAANGGDHQQKDSRKILMEHEAHRGRTSPPRRSHLQVALGLQRSACMAFLVEQGFAALGTSVMFQVPSKESWCTITIPRLPLHTILLAGCCPCSACTTVTRCWH